MYIHIQLGSTHTKGVIQLLVLKVLTNAASSQTVPVPFFSGRAAGLTPTSDLMGLSLYLPT